MTLLDLHRAGCCRNALLHISCLPAQLLWRTHDEISTWKLEKRLGNSRREALLRERQVDVVLVNACQKQWLNIHIGWSTDSLSDDFLCPVTVSCAQWSAQYFKPCSRSWPCAQSEHIMSPIGPTLSGGSVLLIISIG